jgi:hypothetical protein
MVRHTFSAAVLLILTGAVGYFASQTGSLTALIPVGFGAALLLTALIALKGPAFRKHAMHVAVVIGLIGFAGAMSRLPKSYDAWQSCVGEGRCPLAFLCQASMAAICFIFVLAAILSFIRARLDKSD